MDNLTHSLVGLFLARAGFRYATPHATAIMVVAANAPDIDGVSLLWGGTAFIHYHHNITHSLIAAPLMALISVAVVHGFMRCFGRAETRWVNAWIVATIAAASHLLLDLTNVYGVRLMLPFSGRWTHWDTTPVIDGVILTILLLGVAAPALARLVGSEIGERNKDAGKAGWAFTALLLLCGYDYGRSVLHDRAVDTMSSHIYNGLAARRVAAFPSQNPLVWRGVAELSNAFVELPIDFRGSFHTSDEQTWIKPPRTPAVEAALRTFAFQRLLEFVQWPLWIVEPNRVTLMDLRFGTPRDPLFAASAVFDESGRIVGSRFGINAGRQP